MIGSTVSKVVETYNYVFTDLADPRTNNYFLIASPWPIVALAGLYLYFCTSLGPRYMKHRPPYSLKNIVLVYNIFQVLMSTFLFYECIVYICSEKFNIRCELVDYSDDPRALRAASSAWWYFFSKVTEFLDTIFFVLRKKNNHVSFLHVYHHTLMVFFTWFGVKYMAVGHGIVLGTLNTFVHIVMYTYYLIAGLGPEYQKYVWWKKHVTILQLAQFVIVLVHNANALFSDCSYPKIPNILMCFNSILFINLFGRFFIVNYIAPNRHGAVSNGTSKTTPAPVGTDKNETYADESKKTLLNGEIYTNEAISNVKHKNA